MKQKIIKIIRCYNEFDGKQYSFPRGISEIIAAEIVRLFDSQDPPICLKCLDRAGKGLVIAELAASTMEENKALQAVISELTSGN